MMGEVKGDADVQHCNEIYLNDEQGCGTHAWSEFFQNAITRTKNVPTKKLSLYKYAGIVKRELSQYSLPQEYLGQVVGSGRVK